MKHKEVVSTQIKITMISDKNYKFYSLSSMNMVSTFENTTVSTSNSLRYNRDLPIKYSIKS